MHDSLTTAVYNYQLSYFNELFPKDNFKQKQLNYFFSIMFIFITTFSRIVAQEDLS